MPPKGRKIKINVKEIMEKRLLQGIRQEGQQQQGQVQNQVLNIDANDQNQERKKQSKGNQGSKKHINKQQQFQKRRVELGSKKEVTLKNLIKLATNQIYQQRKQMKFPLQKIQQVSKQHSSIRLVILFQKLHNHYFKIFEVFKDNGFNQMDEYMNKFSNRITTSMKELKQNRISQINSVKSISNEDYNEKLLLYYNMEIKLKDDEIKRKKNFRQNAKNRFLPQIKQIQNFITKNARIVTQIVLREKFQSIIDKVVIINNEIVAKKQSECDKDIKLLFSEWRKIKQQKMMLDKLKRAEKLEKEENNRKILASKFPNMMGVLLDCFTIFQKIRL